jgi:uncharacterized repeat protein (TIGR03943 family)
MRSKNHPWLSEYWLGLGMALAGIIMSIWLGVKGKLDLYIHPRYTVFTLLMSALAFLIISAGFWRRLHRSSIISKSSGWQVALGAVCIVISVGLLISRPSPLTSTTANQRGVNAGSLDLSTQTNSTTISTNGDYSRFTVKEWSSLLAQTSDPHFFVGKKAHLVGFVTAVSEDKNSFYVSRFVITCCAVDARAIGVPVYSPGWQNEYRENQWVQIDGSFVQNTASASPSIVVKPANITKINTPDDPYAF